MDTTKLRKENSYFQFYGEHNISPVRQNIDNIEMHYKRREKLYRLLGMPVNLFKDKEILEIGPGVGTIHWLFLNGVENI